MLYTCTFSTLQKGVVHNKPDPHIPQHLFLSGLMHTIRMFILKELMLTGAIV